MFVWGSCPAAFPFASVFLFQSSDGCISHVAFVCPVVQKRRQERERLLRSINKLEKEFERQKTNHESVIRRLKEEKVSNIFCPQTEDTGLSKRNDE